MFEPKIKNLHLGIVTVLFSLVGCDQKASIPAEQSTAGKSADQVVLSTKAAVGDKLADEFQSFTAEQAMTVKYGTGTRFVQKEVSGNVNCGNGTFGDPAPGVQKACYLVSLTLTSS